MTHLHLAVPLLAFLLLGASCGPRTESPGQGTGSTPEGEPAEHAEGESEGHDHGHGLPGADAIPLPALPERRVEAPVREAPTIRTLEEAEAAFAAGFYEAVGEAVVRLGAPAAWLRARHAFATGNYDAAIQSATRLSRSGPHATGAKLLAARAHMARGQLDEAETILTAASQDANAHEAHVLLGQLLNRRGRTAEARRVLMEVIGAYNDERITNQADGLAWVGEAAWALGSARDANDAFREAHQAEAGRAATLLPWARLFLAKYDAGHAEENVREVLQANPEHPEALALMARIRIEQSYDFAEAETLTERALAVNPNLVEGHLTMAGLALRDLDIAGADARVDAALAIDPKDLEALSMRAAIRYLADDEQGYERARRAVFAEHRTYSDFYDVVGDYAEWEHRYPDLVRMSREALDLNSRDVTALASLGINQLRMGNEEEGLQALHDAWRRDRFNVRVYNLLNLYDEVIPQQYTQQDAGPFRFRFHNDEQAVLERYVPRAMQEAYRRMVQRYGFTPQGPLSIEMYADQGHFAVRTSGLPNLGVQGVCFGQVVTSISPTGGPFNWGQINIHELAHVFHIQLSNNHVPRWFTEGLAEYEANQFRPEWRREMDHHLYDALTHDGLPPLRLMNRAFTRARSGMAVMVAYYASTHIVRYIAETHGFDKVVAMLRAWGRGLTSAEVVQRVLGMDIDTLDTRFRESERQRLQNRANDYRVEFEHYMELEEFAQAAEERPQDAIAVAEHAAALLVSAEREQATAEATRALSLSAQPPSDDNAATRVRSTEDAHALARMVLAAAATRPTDIATHLEALLASGKDGYHIRLLLARAAIHGEDRSAARGHLEAATRIDGDRPEAWQGLLQLAGDDAAQRLSALRRLALIDEHDRASHRALLSALVEGAVWDEVITVGERSVYVDPHNADVHLALARGYANRDRHDEALYEADTALLCNPERPGDIQLVRAFALRNLGRTQDARAAVDAAVAADSSLRARGEEILSGN